MAYRILELTLIFASDLKKVSFFSRMRVYAIASISGGDSRMRTHYTQVDSNGGQNPAWNAMFHFPISASADTGNLALHVLLRSEAPFFGHRDVGEVFVPLNDLFINTTIGGDPNTMSYPVWRPLSHARGVLYFSYKFTDIKADTVAPASATKSKEDQYAKNSRYCEVAMAKAMIPVTAYPQPGGVPYGTPYMVYPHGYAPPTPYIYTPPAMYMYAPPSMAQPARHTGGMGLGLDLGLIGGAAGGMMLGDMISDFEVTAYDAGINDGMSF